MKKTLNTIQVLMKIGQVLSTIVFVCSIIGAIGCLIGLICSAVTGSIPVLVAGLGIFDKAIGREMQASAVGMIKCLGEMILAYYAKNFFKDELAMGTPFTMDISKKMLHLGIKCIVIPIITAIVCGIVWGILLLATGSHASFDFDNGGNVALGIMFIILSVFIKYTAQKEAGIE